MFGPSTSSNGRSTDTPPRCTIAPQPSASRSDRHAIVQIGPGERGTRRDGSGNGVMSVSRSVQPSAASAFVSTRPRLPDAPVSRTGFGGRVGHWHALSSEPRGHHAHDRATWPRVLADGQHHQPRAWWKHVSPASPTPPARVRGRSSRCRGFGERNDDQPRFGGSDVWTRIDDPDGEDRAPSSRCCGAGACDGRRDGRLRRVGRAPSRYAGIPVSLKDLFDIAGEPTPAGSACWPTRRRPDACARGATHARRRLRPGGPHQHDGVRLLRSRHQPALRHAASPWDRAAARIPGGSSSGTAVSVSDGMAIAGLGTDTGGSCRIPAAFCGIVGYKPTARRVPITGVLPLAPSLDSVGPLAPSVAAAR